MREIVAESPVMREVLEHVAAVAPSRIPVLVIGESGTGKELLAREIARRSARRDLPFVAVNCAAFADNLLESELFGHVRGAFTHATGNRRGLFEEATGGTLFLDEIGDISAATQVRLLRALQEGEIRPVGSDRARRVDVRVISATNRDLRAAVRAGEFRSDLLYRLDGFRIRLPPLRARRDDIAPLARVFLARYADGESIALEPAALTALANHPWPGNVRELESAIQRAVVLRRGGAIDARTIGRALQTTMGFVRPATAPPPLPPAASSPPVAVAATPHPDPAALPYADARERVLAEFTRSYVLDVLGRSGGEVTAAARLAGMDRSNFRRLMRRFGVRQLAER